MDDSQTLYRDKLHDSHCSGNPQQPSETLANLEPGGLELSSSHLALWLCGSVATTQHSGLRTVTVRVLLAYTLNSTGSPEDEVAGTRTPG